MVAAFKAAMVPVNTNYRYGAEEIVYLFDNADAEAVVFHAGFAELLDGIRGRLPKVQALVRRRRRHRRRPGLGGAVRGRRRTAGGRAARGAAGRAAATTCCCSTPAAPPACRRA